MKYTIYEYYGRHVLVLSDHKPLVSIVLKDLDKVKNNRLKQMKIVIRVFQ